MEAKNGSAYFSALLLALIAVAIILGFFVFTQRSTEARQNGFTVLYFTDYNKHAGGNEIAFSFAIENRGAQKTDYFVDINFDSGTVKTIELSLGAGEKRIESMVIPFDGKHGAESHKISVSLRGRKESIFYWTDSWQ